jgi:Lipase (class 3)
MNKHVHLLPSTDGTVAFPRENLGQLLGGDPGRARRGSYFAAAMSALVGLGPLLDPSALWSIAQQLWAARDRLALRTGANIPSASELLVALRMYMNDQDRKRAAAAAAAAVTQAEEDSRFEPELASASQPNDHGRAERSDDTDGEGTETQENAVASLPSSVADLGHCLMLAEAAYADHKEDLIAMLNLVNGDEFLLEARWYSSRCHPAYYIAYDTRLEAIVLSVRGSKEIADFITNLSCDTAPFHGGYGHSGIVQSAQNLAAVVAPNLLKYLEAHRPRNGLIVVGHSLGAAIASLLTIMIRTGTLEEHISLAQPPPRRVSSSRSTASVSDPPAFSSTLAADVSEGWRSRTGIAADVASTTKCYAFSGPPCVSPGVARLSRNLGVTTLVLGLDIVPRLSAGTLDTLLLSISRYDWRGEMSGNVEEGLRSFLSQALGAASGAAAAAAIANVGPNLIGPLVGMIQRSAQSALAASNQRPRGAPPGPGMHPAQKLMLGAVAVGGGFLLHQFFQPQPALAIGGGRGQREQYSFASRFGLTPEQVEDALIPNQPEVLHLPGRLWHIDRPFTSPEQYRNDASLPPARLVEREPEFFDQVEASSWMLHDHHPPNIGIALTTLSR